MKKISLVFAILASLFISCGNKTTTNSDTQNTEISVIKPFVSEKYNFSVLFPQTPTQSTQATPTDAGNIDLNMFVYSTDEEAYFIGISDMPKALVDASNKNDILQGGKTGALGELGDAKILSEKNITINGHPGIEFEAKGSSQDVEMLVKGRFYMVDNRLYQIYVLAQGSAKNKVEITKFVESFKLLK
jgi:hypothetical protein